MISVLFLEKHLNKKLLSVLVYFLVFVIKTSSPKQLSRNKRESLIWLTVQDTIQHEEKIKATGAGSRCYCMFMFTVNRKPQMLASSSLCPFYTCLCSQNGLAHGELVASP